MTSIAASAPSLTVFRQRQASRARRMRRTLPFILLGPSLLLLAGFTYWPILRVIWDSLHDKSHATGKTDYVGLANYTGLFSDEGFRQSVVNNLVYAVGTV